MQPSDLIRVKQLFLEASELPPGNRVAFLDAQPDLDAAVRSQVEKLLAQFDRGLEQCNSELDDLPLPILLTPKLPKSIGRFFVQAELGRGGQGIVYLAFDERLHRRVAIKVLSTRAASDETLRRFRQEKELTARLDHPGICAIHDAGEFEGSPFVAMQAIEGEPLSSMLTTSRESGASAADLSGVIAESPVTGARPRSETSTSSRNLDDIATLIEHVARALQVAHDAFVVHRDIKPGNIMVKPGGSPVILDFGLAKATQSDLPSLTHTGDVMGTPAYMSPEQVTPSIGPAGASSDIYSLGVTLFECLTLNRPFSAPNWHRLFDQIRNDGPPDPRDLNPMIPRDLSVITRTAMEKEPRRRYATAEAFADDLRRFVARRPILARPVTRRIRLQRWTQRHPQLAAAMVLAVLVLTSVSAVSLFETMKARQAGRAADDAALAATASLSARQRASDERLARMLIAEANEELWPPVPERVAAMDRWIEITKDLLERRPGYESELTALRAIALPYSQQDERQDVETHPEAITLLDIRRQLDILPRQSARAKRRRAELEALPVRNEREEEALEFAKAELAFCEEWGPLLRERLGPLERKVMRRRTWRFRDLEGDAQRHEVLAALCASLERLGGDDGLLAQVRERRSLAVALPERSMDAHEDAWAEVNDRLRKDPRFAGRSLPAQLGLVPLGPDRNSGLEEFCVLEQTGDVPVRDPVTGQLILTETTGIVLILIPGGTFWMGAQRGDPAGMNYDPSAAELEYPPNEVMLSPFFIGKYEVTQGQWVKLAGDNPSLGVPPMFEGLKITFRHPVNSVTWNASVDVLRRANLTLPTEAQWEYACRAGTTTAWWCGDTVDSIGKARAGNISDRSAGKNPMLPPHEPTVDDGFPGPAPVGSLAPNGFGLHDTIGNMWEWCLDESTQFQSHPPYVGHGRRGGDSPDVPRVIKGGGYQVLASHSRSARRQGQTPKDTMSQVGARAARPIDWTPRRDTKHAVR